MTNRRLAFSDSHIVKNDTKLAFYLNLLGSYKNSHMILKHRLCIKKAKTV